MRRILLTAKRSPKSRSAKKGFDFDIGVDGEGDCGNRRRNKNFLWSKMLARVFKIDVLKCSCGGRLRPICAVTDPDSVRRYLKHMNVEYVPPPRGPPRYTQDAFDFDDCDQTPVDNKDY